MRILLILTLLLSSSCIGSIAKYEDENSFPFRATAIDAIFLVVHHETVHKPYNFSNEYHSCWYPAFIVDLPFSIVFDTITLPYDIYLLCNNDEISEEGNASDSSKNMEN